MTTANMSTKETAYQLGVTVGTMFNWRQLGYGPAWFRLGPRIIRYRVSDIEEWEDRLRNAE